MKRLTLVNVSKGFANGLMPLGLLSISAYIKRYGTGIDIKFLDSNCQDIYDNFEPTDVIGISAVTQDFGRAIQFAEFVRSKYDIPIVLGGVHISTYRKLPKQFDVGVIGEGEQTMLELIQLTDFSHEKLKAIKGICFDVGGRTFLTEPRDLITQLDDIPIPDRDIANISFYSQPRQIIPYYYGRSFTMISSRGCPFNCVFCSSKIHWQKFRAFSAKRVVEEIELLINRYHAEIIHIFDDLFIADKRRLFKIHQLIVEKKINEKVKFMCLVRSDMVDDQTMKILKEMNVVVIGIGMESGSERILEYLKRKTTTIGKNKYAIELSTKYAIPTMGSFMVGNPYETEDDLLKTLNFIRSYRTSPFLTPLTYIATAFPGTEFWSFALENGIAVENFDKIVMDIPDDISKLKEAPLLTSIPLDRFFEIISKFPKETKFKETKYGNVKRNVFMPKNLVLIIRAYKGSSSYRKNLFIGIIEVTKILFAYIRYKLKHHSYTDILKSDTGFKMITHRVVDVCSRLKYTIDLLVAQHIRPEPYKEFTLVVKFNRILDNVAREEYSPVIEQMNNFVPRMMSRKIPEADVQQAFVLDSVYKFAKKKSHPKILCVGSYEDTAAASLKMMGYRLEEIDPALNYDLDAYFRLPTTAKASFDIIFSTSVIEHVADDETFISQIAALLSPGGVCILTCDYNNNYKPGDRLPQTDLRFYTKRDFTERLIPRAKGCSLVDEPQWEDSIPDFICDGCLYSFATLTFQKDVL